MLVMFAVFTVLFFKDWKVGYPKQNLVYYTHEAFEKARESFKEGKEVGLGEAECGSLSHHATGTLGQNRSVGINNILEPLSGHVVGWIQRSKPLIGRVVGDLRRRYAQRRVEERRAEVAEIKAS